MKIRSGTFVCATLIVLCSYWNRAEASSFHFGVGNSFVLFNKVSGNGAVTGMAPVGVTAWGGYFLTDRLSGVGMAEINLETAKYTAVFVGGSAVVNYYLAGGASKEINSKYLTASTAPRFNASLFLGGGGSAYNFNAFDASTGRVVKRAANNTLKGSVIGTVIGSSISVAVTRNAFINLQGKIFKGLTDESTPAITNIVFGGGMEVLF